MLSFSNLHFIRPYWWLALLPVILLLILVWRAQQRSLTPWTKVCDAHLLARLLNQQPQQRRWPFILWALSLFFTVLALTGPTWSKQPIPVFESAENIVIVLDVSPSMDTPDLTPSRLARAKYKILDLLKKLQGNRVGMIAFTGESFVVAPLSSDTQTIALLVPSLFTNIMPIAGSDMSSGLQAALDLLKNDASSAGQIILFTDSTPDAKANELAATLPDHHVQLTVIGVGTKTGAPLRDAEGQFINDRLGNPILSPLDDQRLQALAQAAQGNYLTFSSDNADIDSIAQKILVHQHGKTSLIKTETTAWLDQGRWFILPVLLIALMAFRRGWLEEILA